MAKKPGQAATAKPTITKPEPKKTGRVDFSGIGNKDPELYPFKDAVPEGFDFKLHRALKKRDFSADYLFYEFRAAEMDYKGSLFRDQAEEAKKLGSAADRGRAKRLIKLQEKMSELKEQLTAQGINVDELLATVED